MIGSDQNTDVNLAEIGSSRNRRPRHQEDGKKVNNLSNKRYKVLGRTKS